MKISLVELAYSWIKNGPRWGFLPYAWFMFMNVDRVR
jgi:hypothetical protein